MFGFLGCGDRIPRHAGLRPRLKKLSIAGLFCFIAMKHFVYIIYSEKLSKFYVGFSENVPKRLDQHNQGISTFTSKGIPWELKHTFEVETIEEARKLEKAIKGRGIIRYLADKGIKL